ncbi:MAG TPA: 30S ribosomal protein S3 [Anaerolineaceae bacterium]|nr:30S ribosomal protein S3 [Anaerolineaceae bacterium]HPN53711.1 30S ribosomal protein S3 [Anaerolineaceae bacterium]
MGRKVHPIGFRLNINAPWLGRWYAEGQEYREQLHQDFKIRELIHVEAEKAGVSRVEVERFPGKVKVVVHTAKPGILIGRKGEAVKKMRQSLEALTSKKIDLEIKEIKNPDTDAYLVATNIAGQIERRVSYRRAMKRAIQQGLRQGALGMKVEVAGRLSGAEMARSVTLREGRVPLQTLRADIDFARYQANTTYGKIGIKVWVYRGDVYRQVEEKVEATEGVYVSE